MLRFISLCIAAILCSPAAIAGQSLRGQQANPHALVSQVRYQPQPVPAEIQRKLNEAAGRTLYACHRTGLILLENREERHGESVLYYGTSANVNHLAYMTPWKVIGIDRLNDVAGWSFFGLRLRVEDGSVMVVNGIAVSPAELQSSSDLLQTLADKAGLFTSIAASGIHFTDLRAVQTGEIHRGMSQQEVACALGPAEQTSVDSTGRQKDIYDGGRLVVYLAGGTVVNIQHPAAPQLETRAAE